MDNSISKSKPNLRGEIFKCKHDSKSLIGMKLVTKLEILGQVQIWLTNLDLVDGLSAFVATLKRNATKIWINIKRNYLGGL